MTNIQHSYQLILELNKLKLVFRNTKTHPERNESTAEHSWSASMIIVVLTNELKKEFGEFDELKAIKLTLIHDIVEIYAGDVTAFDAEARKQKQALEIEALDKLMSLYPAFGKELHQMWHEFETKVSIEAKIAKAADAICPMFLRVSLKHAYMDVTPDKLEKTKLPHLEFSKTFSALFHQLKNDMVAEKLISPN